MQNLFLLVLCIAAGVITKHYFLYTRFLVRGITFWLINVSLPAIALKHLNQLTINKSLIVPVVSPVLAMLVAVLIIMLLKNILSLSKEKTVVLFVTTALSNTSFIGFPLVSAYFGKAGLSTAVICDQVTFLLFATVVPAVILLSKGESTRPLQFIEKIIFFPPFIAFVVALLLPHNSFSGQVDEFLAIPAGTTSPLALFLIGLQLSFSNVLTEKKVIVASITIKLLLVPATVYCIFRCFNLNNYVSTISIFETSMPTLLSLTILAEKMAFNQSLIVKITSISIVVSMISTYLWQLILQ